MQLEKRVSVVENKGGVSAPSKISPQLLTPFDASSWTHPDRASKKSNLTINRLQGCPNQSEPSQDLPDPSDDELHANAPHYILPEQFYPSLHETSPHPAHVETKKKDMATEVVISGRAHGGSPHLRG